MTAPSYSFRQKLRFLLEAGIVYGFYYLFRALPAKTASSLGGAIARCLGPYLPSTATAYKNLALAFPETTPQEKQRIILGMWDNLGRVFAEYPHLHKLKEDIELVGAEHFNTVHASGKSAMFFSGHLANWELGTVSANPFHITVHAIYRRPNNPYVDRLLYKAREDSGAAPPIAKGIAGARGMLSVLKNNNSLAILMDQKLNEGMAIPFFGHDAMMATAIASFALRLQCPIYPVLPERLAGGKFRVTVYPPLKIENTGDLDRDTYTILTEINRYLENWIRQNPEQWMWIHKRWPHHVYNTVKETP